MKQWMIPVVTLLVGAGIAVGAILGVTRPWQSEETIPVFTPAPTTAPQSAFTAEEIRGLTQQRVAATSASGRWVKCVVATYKPGADMWLVGCDFYSDPDGINLVEKKVYTVSDKDGKLVQ